MKRETPRNDEGDQREARDAASSEALGGTALPVLLEVTLVCGSVCCPATQLVEIHCCSPGSRRHLRKRRET